MRVAVVAVLCVLLGACSGVEMKRGTKSHARQDNPQGRGLLTGSKGEIVIFRIEDVPEEEDKAAGKDAPGEESSE